MDTRPKHVQFTVPKASIQGTRQSEPEYPSFPREIFCQARKPDDGDRPRGFGDRMVPRPPLSIAEEG